MLFAAKVFLLLPKSFSAAKNDKRIHSLRLAGGKGPLPSRV
jgi:hypothetical protein